MSGPGQDPKLPCVSDAAAAPVGRLTNTAVGAGFPAVAAPARRATSVAPNLSCAVIRDRLRDLPTRTPIRVTWSNVGDVSPATWYGYVYEAERRRHNGRRQQVHPVEYYLRDDDGDLAILSTYLPPLDGVVVHELEVVDAIPPLAARCPSVSTAALSPPPPPTPSVEPGVRHRFTPSATSTVLAQSPRSPASPRPAVPHESPVRPLSFSQPPPSYAAAVASMRAPSLEDDETLLERALRQHLHAGPDLLTPDAFRHEVMEWDGSEAVFPQLFRQGHQRYPSLAPVAQMSGSDIIGLVDAPVSRVPVWATAALATSTVASHQRALRSVTQMDPSLRGLPAASALTEHFTRLRLAKSWTWATTLKNMATTQGALKLLPLYRQTTTGVALSDDPVWRQAMKTVSARATESPARVPLAMTRHTLQATLTAEPLQEKRIVLALMWSTAARVGDILALKAEDLLLSPDSLAVCIRRGKTTKRRGPYTVHTTYAGDLPELQAWMAAHPQRLFSVTPAEMLLTFRLVDRRLEARSIRRGSLQSMAAAGVPIDTLLEFSGHTNAKSLLRYLLWGVVGEERRARMLRAAGALRA